MEKWNNSWDVAKTVTTVLVNISLLIGAAAAAVKFQLLNLLKRRYRSELICAHSVLNTGKVIFTGDYTIYNIGQRPMHISKVVLRLYPATRDGVLVVPDPQIVLAERVLSAKSARGLFEIEGGERSIFTMRCEVSELPTTVFLVCQFCWPDHRAPAPYVGMYVRPDERKDCFTASTGSESKPRLDFGMPFE